MNLIVTTKIHCVIDSIGLLQHRFRRDSTLLFLEKGMGILEQLFAGIFQDAQSRPNCLDAIHR
jgi:hypothetical protein